MRLLDEKLMGRAIIGADGKVIGEVAGFFLDAEAWRIDALQVKLDRAVAEQLRARHPLFRPALIEIPTHLVQSVGDTIVLSVVVEGLRQVLALGDEHVSVQ